MVRPAALNDFEIFNEPEKDEEPVPEVLKLPVLVMPTADNEPLAIMLPPMEAIFPTSKLLDAEALLAWSNARPVILWLLPVTKPPRVNALIVRVAPFA